MRLPFMCENLGLYPYSSSSGPYIRLAGQSGRSQVYCEACCEGTKSGTPCFFVSIPTINDIFARERYVMCRCRLYINHQQTLFLKLGVAPMDDLRSIFHAVLMLP